MKLEKLIFLFSLVFLFSLSFVSSKLIQENNKFYIEQELNDNWNLISGISINDIHPESEIDKYALWKIYFYDSKTKKNIQIVPDYQAGEIDALTLYSNAFWVFSAVPGKIKYLASPSFYNISKIGNYKFFSGWNSIGINSEIYGKTLNEIKGNCNLEDARIWDSDKQEWKLINLNEKLNFESSDSLVGKGISIKVKEDCLFMNKIIQNDCSDGTKNKYCSINKPLMCINGVLIENCSVCGCNSPLICSKDSCINSDKDSQNVKNLSLYSNKETFLISDKNWRDVLPWVSVAVWTNNSTQESNCQKGYGTPNDVCVYPFLIYHEENKTIPIYYKNLSLPYFEDIYPVDDGVYYIGYPYSFYTLNFFNYTSQTSSWIYSIGAYPYFSALSDGLFVWYDAYKQNITILNLTSKESKDIAYATNLSNLVFNQGKILWTQNIDLKVKMDGFWWFSKDLYVYDINSKIKQKLIENEGISSLAVSNNFAVWNTNFFQISSLYGNIYNFNTNQRTKFDFNFGYITKISPDGKIFFSYKEDSGLNDIYYYNISTGTTHNLVVSEMPFNYLENFENILIYTKNSPSQIFMYNLSSNEESQLTFENNEFIKPKIYKNNIVYVKKINLHSFLVKHEFNLQDSYKIDGFDADSVIYFMQQYTPTNLKIIGETNQELDNLLISPQKLGAGLDLSNIQRMNFENYLSYWKNYKSLVYVEDNYELALLASTYASLINAPLIIKGSYLDNSINLIGKDIICVGNVFPSGNNCNESYNLEQLQQRYVLMTNTDKIILTNPNDLNIYNIDKFTPKKSTKPISQIYTKNSLASSILASSKKELIITNNKNNDELNIYFKERISALFPELIDSSKLIKSEGYNNNFYLTNESSRLYSSFSMPQYFKLKSPFIYFVNIKLFSYDLNSNLLKIISPPSEGSIFGYTPYNDEVLYYLGYQNKCYIYSFNISQSKINNIDSSLSSCLWYPGIYMNSDFYAYVVYNQNGTCYDTGELCSLDSQCSSHYCIKNNSIFLKNKLNGNQESILDYRDLTLIGFINNNLYYKIENRIYVYNLITKMSELLINTHYESFYSPSIFIDGNKIYYIKYDFSNNDQNLYYFNLETKENKLLESNIYITDSHSIMNTEKLILFQSSLSEKRCLRDPSIICNSLPDCFLGYNLYGGDCVPIELKSYNKENGQVSVYKNGLFVSPFIYNNSFYYLKLMNGTNYINGFLTILGSEKSIPLSKNMGLTGSYDNKMSLDSSLYADFNDNGLPDMAVGRINGLTLSDVSGYIARDLFYNSIGATNAISFLAGNGYDDHNGAISGDGISVHNWTEIFKIAGYFSDCAVRQHYSDSCNEYNSANKLITWQNLMQGRDSTYIGHHGSNWGAGLSYEDVPDINNSLFFTMSCSTCSNEDKGAFCYNLLRKGALGDIAAISVAWSGTETYKDSLSGIYKDNLTLGQSYSKNFQFTTGKYMTALIGDPTFKPQISNKINEELKYKWSWE